MNIALIVLPLLIVAAVVYVYIAKKKEIPTIKDNKEDCYQAISKSSSGTEKFP